MAGEFLAIPPPADGSHPDGAEVASRCLATSGWRQVESAAWLWTSPRWETPILCTERVVLVGRAWSQAGSPVTAAALSAVVAAGEPPAIARRLAGVLWGAYVVFLRSAADGSWWVFRTASGAQSALVWRAAGLGLVGSSLGSAPSALRPPSGVVIDRVIDHLRRPDIAQAWSPLAAVSVVAPGQVMRCGPGDPSGAMAWTPAMAVRRRFKGRREDAVSALRTAVETACTAETDGTALLLELSGGLDSAIVAAALAATGRRGAVCAAVNFFGDRADGDERAWAAQVAAHLDLPFAAQVKSLTPFSERDFDELSGEATPAIDTLDADRDRTVAAWRADCGATAVVTGQGGDAVFFQAVCAGMLREAMAAGGPQAKRLGLLLDLARRRRSSIWPVLREAIRPPTPGFQTFLAPEALADRATPQHPWLADLDGLGPAQRAHVRGLVAMLPKFGPSRRRDGAEVLHPLLAQPVTEACLAMPSWWHVAGGRDRALARDAFAPALPPGLAARASKGAMSSFYARRMALSLDVLRPYLLDGGLAQAGLLDRSAVAAVLQPEDLIWRGRGLGLLRVCAVEAWVRRWA